MISRQYLIQQSQVRWQWCQLVNWQEHKTNYYSFTNQVLIWDILCIGTQRNNLSVLHERMLQLLLQCRLCSVEWLQSAVWQLDFHTLFETQELLQRLEHIESGLPKPRERFWSTRYLFFNQKSHGSKSFERGQVHNSDHSHWSRRCRNWSDRCNNLFHCKDNENSWRDWYRRQRFDSVVLCHASFTHNAFVRDQFDRIHKRKPYADTVNVFLWIADQVQQWRHKNSGRWKIYHFSWS